MDGFVIVTTECEGLCTAQDHLLENINLERVMDYQVDRMTETGDC